MLESQHLHDRRSDTFDLTLTVAPNPKGKLRNIDVPTLDVPKDGVVEVDIAEQSTI